MSSGYRRSGPQPLSPPPPSSPLTYLPGFLTWARKTDNAGGAGRGDSSIFRRESPRMLAGDARLGARSPRISLGMLLSSGDSLCYVAIFPYA